ncbi:MAG: proteobacterial dedicated sortase system response regulator [Rhodospirillaceae bacterium]|nr:proteobacterial dedicated sortase system response regulator [Rhodospirillaceae bacterium]MDE0362832.1 proteobacterial dedicated sortase system response regulator [Rhodospirillaceae bacterium]
MNAGKLIAVVEDEIAIRDNYMAALRRQGYRVAGHSSRREALEAFEARLPDLVIIDINLSGEVEGGFELCRELRARSTQLPIIFLTARESELDAISGLRLGADDYLTKRISLEHLLARVAALLRRVEALTNAAAEPRLLSRGPLEMDLDRVSVSWNDVAVPLTLTEFWVVHALARHPGHVRTREQLMAAANVVLDHGSVTSQIKRIRAKFSTADPQFGAIDTVYGMGYRWISPQPGPGD